MNRFFAVISGMCRQANSLRMRLPQLWYGLTTNKSESGMSATLLKSVLEEGFPNAKEIEVKDFSEGRGWVYTVLIETNEFQGLSLLQQHRAVYAALGEHIKVTCGIHIVTKIPPQSI